MAKRLVNKLTETRQIDKNFEMQVISDRVHTYERHFRAEDIEDITWPRGDTKFLFANE